MSQLENTRFSSLVLEDVEDIEISSVEEKWNLAVENAKSKLPRSDYEMIRSFGSAEALIEDLSKRQMQIENHSWLPNRREVLPTVRALNASVATFMLAVSPLSLEFTLLWGLIHLITTLSIDNKSRWFDFVGRLEKIRRQIVILNTRAKTFPLPADELSLAMVNVFTCLIGFWVETVKWMRDQPLNVVTKTLDPKFLKAMDEVEASMSHLKQLASILDPRYHERLQRLDMDKRARQDDLAGRMEASDDLAIYPINLLPTANHSAVFYGRDEIFDEIDAALKGPPDTLRSVLIHGLGGVGKTQTALTYAHRKADDYDAVLWVHSDTQMSISASITKIARVLCLPGSMNEGNDEQNLLAFQSWLLAQAARKQRGRQWLLVFDNVENMEHIQSKYVPTTGGSVIITSRYSDSMLPTSSLISLKPFAIDDATELLRRSLRFPSTQLVHMEDHEALRLLAKRVDGLPLALRVISGLMNFRQNTKASEFSSYYEKTNRRLLKQSTRIMDYGPDISRNIGREHVLDRVWHLSFTELDGKPEAKTLLGIMALLCPDAVPVTLFRHCAAKTIAMDEIARLCDEDGFGIDTATVMLTQMALMDYDGTNMSIHRLVQDAYIHFCIDNNQIELLQKSFDGAVQILYHSFPQQINGRPMHNDWDKCAPLIQHAKWLTDRYAEIHCIATGFRPPENLGELLKSTGWYLFEMADHRAAIKMLDVAREVCTDTESELYAHLLNTIGCCAFELNDLIQCRQTWTAALSIRESWAKRKAKGAEEELANQLNNFGNLESAEGNYDTALAFFDRAKGIRMRLGDDLAVPLGVSHMTTGRAYFLKGHYSDALEHYRKAEELFVEKLGRSTHFMAHLNYAYGNLELARNAPSVAEGFYARARAILEADTPFHLLLAATYYKIACIRTADDENIKEALELLDKGLAIAEFQQGNGDVARILMKKAALYSKGTPEEISEARVYRSQVERIVLDLPGLVISLDDEDEDEWNAWVCPYWR